MDLRFLRWGNPGPPGNPSRAWHRRNLVTVNSPFPWRNAYASRNTEIRAFLWHRKEEEKLRKALADVWRGAIDKVREKPEYADLRLELKRKHGFDRSSEFYDNEMRGFLDRAALKVLQSFGGDLFGGSFVHRWMVNKRKLSKHALGVALDANPQGNPYRGRSTTFPDWYIEAFTDNGFTWGGHWRRRDPMHFEIK